MNHQKARYILFFSLFLYVLAQLFWWGYQLIQSYQKNVMDVQMLQYKIWMVLGEGTVFLILLFIGFRYIYKSIKNEIQSAQLESTFLLSVTHELKTPIASIRLMLDTLLIRKTDENQQKQLIRDAQQELLRLQNQIENILLTTRTQSHSFEKKDERAPFSTLLHEPVRKIKKWYPNARIEWDFPKEETLFFDPELFSALIVNLVENAIIHGNAEQEIQAHFSIQDQHLCMEIKDQGKGIPEPLKKQITQRFFSQNTSQPGSQGTGLGLYLVENIIQHYHGTLNFASNTPSGTIVQIRIPI